MPSAKNLERLAELKEILGENGNFVVTTYSGLDVEKISEIRREIRGSEGRMKVVKNNIFHLALKESPDHKDIAEDIRSDLKGPVAVTFAQENFPAVSKLLVKFAKDLEQVEIKAGFMDGEYLKKADVITVATLPSKEELLVIIARGLNAPATKIATGLNEIISKLARGIKEVAAKQ